ncbi:histidine phosphatase family protein [Marinobacterium stanieri]|uniref:2,3-bisphosphoglycerate-dependent phosphoglycerate mutase n=1 Tax=Marinobacterium stanieri TaxID=49186 RepID=A0A1N6T665_9GAMM|nr:histidine phosphatase family protein [Marinobacterium stanieri]SIQ48868.1 2,3-bisphosphoglycerate-dependent phosphoglycerate mutase [Marinobacterium stanieri]
MTKLIALIRHGDYEQLAKTPSALQPYPLTDEGAEEVRQQARRFRDWLEQQDIRPSAEVHCSTLLRAWQTAQLYMEELADLFSSTPELQSFPDLCERRVGSVANLSTGEIERILELDPRFEPAPKGWKSDSHYRLPLEGAESLMDAGTRVAGHLRLCAAAPERGLQLVFGHGAAFRHAAYHLNVIEFDDIKRLSMYHGHPVVLQQDPLTGWSHHSGEWKIRQKSERPD